MNIAPVLDINLHPKQYDAYTSQATEVLYGGAAGGGKSFLMRVAAILWCAAIPGLQVYLFRRIYDDLVKNHIEGSKGFRVLLAPWVLTGWVSIVESEIRFWNGSKIYLCHCEHEKHRFKYQGAEIHVLLIDELTTFTEVIYKFLRTRVRMTSIELPKALKGSFPRIMAGSNPGNIGHGWVKRTFVQNRKPMAIERMGDEEGGMLRQFIPALLEDNPTMEKDDPTYRARLRGMGSAALVKAFEKGDWDAVAGSFLEDVFDSDRHVVAPFAIPSTWKVWRAMDWGSAAPYSVGWWALSPDGVYYRWRELYGAGEKEGQGTKESVAQVCKKIKRIEEHDTRLGYEYRQNVADSAIFSNAGHEQTIAQLFRREGMKWLPSFKGRGSRVNGAQVIIQLLKEDKLKIFSTCKHWIRTVPILMPDELNPEDVNTKMEDHAWDETMYALGPIRRAPDEEQKSDDSSDASYNEETQTFTLRHV